MEEYSLSQKTQFCSARTLFLSALLYCMINSSQRRVHAEDLGGGLHGEGPGEE